MFAWLAIAACADPHPPPPLPDDPQIEGAPTQPPRVEPWHLVGRARPGVVDVPPLDGGSELLGERCAALAARIGGDGSPCLAERWEGPSGPRTLLVSGDRGVWADATGDKPVQARWATLGDVLGACLGDPFAVPPAGDAGGARGYDGGAWVLVLTGQNRCRLAGTIRLALAADRVDLDALTADGQPWHRGGRERATAIGVRTP